MFKKFRNLYLWVIGNSTCDKGFFVKNLKFIYIVIIFIFTFILFYKSGLYIGQDYNGYVGTSSFLNNLYVWHNDGYIFNHIALLIKYFPVFIFNTVWFDIFFSTFLAFFLVYCVWFFSVYRFLRYFYKLWDNYNLFISLWYTFNLHFFIKYVDWHIDFTLFYLFLPLVLYSLFKFMDEGKCKYILFFVLSIVFLQNIFISPYLFFLELLVLFVLFIYVIFKKDRKKIGRLVLLYMILWLTSWVFLFEYVYYSTFLKWIIEWDNGTRPLDFVLSFSKNYTVLWKNFIGLWYRWIAEGFFPNSLWGSFYFPNLHSLSQNILYLFFSFVFVFSLVFWSAFSSSRLAKKGLYVFCVWIFLQVFYYFLIKFWLYGLIKWIISVIPFFREPVWKVEWIAYLGIIMMLASLLQDQKEGKYKKMILVWLVFSFILNLYLYLTAFWDRYTTPYLSREVYNQQKTFTNLLHEKEINVSRYSILSDNMDSAVLPQDKNVYSWVDPLIWLLKYDYFFTPWSIPYSINHIKTPEVLLEENLKRSINLVIFRKNFFSKSFLGESNLKKREVFLNKYQKYKIFEDKLWVVLFFWEDKKIVFNWAYGLFQKKSPVEYNISLLNLKQTKIILKENFHPGWKLYIQNKTLLWNALFEETHHLVNDYANGRTLDAEYIKKNFPKDYYKENPDGSIDVNLTLYFKPQSYFYLWLGVSGLTFFWLIAWLLVDRRRQKNLVQQTSAWTKNLH